MPDMSQNIPVFVDLDGTLVRTDIAQELMMRSFGSARTVRGLAAAALRDGRSGVKRVLSDASDLRADLLPYNQAVLDHIRAARDQGRTVVLATAADRMVAEQIAEHTGLFDAVLASEPGRNLKGAAKLEAIREFAGGDDFEYLGDTMADMPIWQAASRRGFVNPPGPARALHAAEPERTSLHVEDRKPAFGQVLKAMRPHQWAKNGLVMLPLLFSHSYGDPASVLAALAAFLIFSLCASAVYLINDMVDIDADRAHAKKRHRPFAAGRLAPVTGVMAAAGLFTFSILAAFLAVGTLFGLVLLAYIALTTAYSFFLKQRATIDVVLLALLFTIRIIAGAAAIGVELTPWLLNFALFFFLSLAYMKRYIEISRSAATGKVPSRDYSPEDLGTVQAFGIANGTASLLMLALYLNSQTASEQYASPTLLWLSFPVMVFWICRAWMEASRGRIDDDPVVYVLKDRTSLIAVGVVLAIVIGARYIAFGGIAA